MKDLLDWVAEQHAYNMFEGCETYDDVESVINELFIYTDYDRQELIERAWEYVQERL